MCFYGDNGKLQSREKATLKTGKGNRGHLYGMQQMAEMR